jgi:hypothetical protein
MASRAIPSHLKPEGGFNSQRHHGKSQSHVVSWLSLLPLPYLHSRSLATGDWECSTLYSPVLGL